ncbi:MAG: hypothetical protein K6F28_02540 [Lachnospiraceae bacterium]|nr:hypothetical protein [Lachnospiraceae bacterium]
MKKIFGLASSYPIVPVFAAITLCMFAGYLFGTQNDFSQMENRYLAKRPGLTIGGLLDGSYMDSFESYTNEQIPLRDLLVKCKAVCVGLTGSSENNGIAKGKDGYLFDKVIAFDRVERNIASIGQFVRSAERDVYIAIAPTSTRINEDKLPAGMPVLDEKTCDKMLKEELEGVKNAHIIDLYGALSADRDKDLYYRTDHHWTTEGAGCAYREIASAMGFEPGDIGRYKKHEVHDFYGTFYAKYKGLGIKGDTIEYYDVPIKELALKDRTLYNLMDEEKLGTYDKYGAFMYGNDGEYTVDTGRGDGRRLIILKDSYANCLIPYLVMNYDKIRVMDLRYFGGNVSEALAEDSEADILLMYNWTFVNDDNHFYRLVGK